MSFDLNMLDECIGEPSITDFNDIPVEYCTKCLSLRVMNYQGRVKSYCDECGCTDIEKIHIEEWEKLYSKKYGKTLLPK